MYMYYAELTRSSIELAFYPSHAPARARKVQSLNHQPPSHEPIEILVHSSLLLLRGRRSKSKIDMKRNASTIPRREKFNERKSVRNSIRMIHAGKSTHLLHMPCQVEKEKWEIMIWIINHLPSTTLLHSTSRPPSGHAWKQQRTDPVRCGCGWWW